MIRNRINIFLLLSFLSILNVGFSAMEKRLEVNTESSSFQKKLIDIETISQGLISREMFYSIPVRSLEENPIVKFIISDAVVYAIKDCQFNVWEWKGTTWVDLYRNNNKGWCLANYYFVDEKLYGYTAEGFWTSVSGIYFFDSQAGNWELVNVKNKTNNFFSKIDFRIGTDTIISLIGISDEYGIRKLNPDNKNYGFDFKTKLWFSVENHSEINILGTFSSDIGLQNALDMEKTVHLFSNKYYIILDKKSLSYYYVRNIDLHNYDFYYSTNSTATIMMNDGEIITLKDEVPVNAVLAGTISFSELNEVKDESQEHNLFLWILIGVIFLITSVIGLFWKLKSSKNNAQLFQESSLILISRITESTGQAMNSNELDMMIGINDDPNPDSRRVKRSRIIQDLNTEYKQLEGKVLITRQRDPKDKRYMLYHIEK